eukprot:2065411-Amphidinium_carterae.1
MCMRGFDAEVTQCAALRIIMNKSGAGPCGDQKLISCCQTMYKLICMNGTKPAVIFDGVPAA